MPEKLEMPVPPSLSVLRGKKFRHSVTYGYIYIYIHAYIYIYIHTSHIHTHTNATRIRTI